jgi:hypothetical protein
MITEIKYLLLLSSIYQNRLAKLFAAIAAVKAMRIV